MAAVWLPDFNTDMGAESGAPQGDVTEEQVRKWLLENGLDEAEIEKVLGMRTGKTPTDENAGNPLADEGRRGMMSDTQEEADSLGNPFAGGDARPAMPTPMFPGDRMGRYQNEGNPFAGGESNPANPIEPDGFPQKGFPKSLFPGDRMGQ